MAKTYSGEAIEITFEMKRCIHARNCFLKLPQVFDPARRPWVDPEAAPAEEIAAMIRTCPSGALGFRRLDGGLEESAAPTNRVTVYENGALSLQGDLSINGESATRVTLCRCGKSQNKPFCDYSHVADGFAATGEPDTQEEATGPVSQGSLTVTAIPDGPLKLDGPMEITGGTGKRVSVCDKAFLCRCGQSSNKPFCDGAHKAAGFKS